jgi:hypothetical protein
MRFRLFCLFLGILALVHGQEYRALISGQVTDSSGAAIPGATVVATNLATNVAVATTGAADGRYVLAQVPTGSYTISAVAPGFKKLTRRGIQLNLGDRVTVNLPLEVGTQTETVTVSAELLGVDTDRSVLNQLMDNKSVSELPLNGRQVFMLMQLSAGAMFTQPTFGSTGYSGTRAWDVNGKMTMHGGVLDSTQYNLDGATISAGTGDWKYAPLVDGIQEFRMSSPNSDASAGLSGGGVLNMTMKSGTNEFHGTASEYVRNNIFDAVATQTHQSSVRAVQHQWNNFSGLMTGPIRKNKLFFSGWYEGYRERVPFPVIDTVPTDRQRVGDFSDTRNASGQLIAIYDPLSTVAAATGYSRTAFPDNQIPAARISAISTTILKYVPRSNTPGNAYTHANNYAAAPNVGQFGYDSWYSKFDYVWNLSNRTTASVNQNWGSQVKADNGFLNSPAYAGSSPLLRTNYGSTLDHVWTASPTTVVDVRLAWQRYVNNSKALDFDGSLRA